MEGEMGGGKARTIYEEPISPRGRLFLVRELEHIIHCTITFKNTVDVRAVKATIGSSFITKCPRLRSLLVTDRSGKECWKELPEIDVDNHIVIVTEEIGGADDEEDRENDLYINRYVASLVSRETLRRDIPLWDIHVLPRRCRSVVVRLHHALGDCVSLVAVLLASCDHDVGASKVIKRKDEEKRREMRPLIAIVRIGSRAVSRAVSKVWYTLPHALSLPLRGANWKTDKTMIANGVRLELLPRKLASVVLSLDDMKVVKNNLNATINDVFVGATAYGLSKYFELKSKDYPNGAVMTGTCAVNMRGKGLEELLELIRQGKRIEWGNKIGFLVLSIDLKEETDDPLNYVRKAKAALDSKKISLEAQLSFWGIRHIMSLFGKRAAVVFSHNLLSSTSLLFSNMTGPSDLITFTKNPILKVGFTASGLPVPIDIRMISYNEKAFLQVLVAENLIPDPELLCTCIEKGLAEMKAKTSNAGQRDKKL